MRISGESESWSGHIVGINYIHLIFQAKPTQADLVREVGWGVNATDLTHSPLEFAGLVPKFGTTTAVNKVQAGQNS